MSQDSEANANDRPKRRFSLRSQKPLKKLDTSPSNDVKATINSPFSGDGQVFKAKLIGLIEVPEARDEDICQASFQTLKLKLKAFGAHKIRLRLQVTLSGLKLMDEKGQHCLYRHPVEKISYIVQDATDERSFGYVFGTEAEGRKFYAFKAEKSSQMVIQSIKHLCEVFLLNSQAVNQGKKHDNDSKEVGHAAIDKPPTEPSSTESTTMVGDLTSGPEASTDKNDEENFPKIEETDPFLESTSEEPSEDPSGNPFESQGKVPNISNFTSQVDDIQINETFDDKKVTTDLPETGTERKISPQSSMTNVLEQIQHFDSENKIPNSKHSINPFDAWQSS